VMRLDGGDGAGDDRGMIVETEIGTAHKVNRTRTAGKTVPAKRYLALRRRAAINGHEPSSMSRIKMLATFLDNTGRVAEALRRPLDLEGRKSGSIRHANTPLE
jgi:hypothetical protein